MYNKFVELLQSNNVTAYQVAKATGIANSTFSDWKAGRSNPKTDKLKKIAAYFGVSVDYFTDDSAITTKEKTHSDESESGRDFIVVHRNGKTQKYHMTAEQIKALEPLLKQLRDEEGPDF